MHSARLCLLIALLIPAAMSCGGNRLLRDWDAFADRFLESYFAANPDFAVYQGRHEFDGFLPDWSEAGLRGEIARLHRLREEVVAFDPTELDARRRFELDYLLSVIDSDLFWLEKAEGPWRNPAYYGNRLDPNVYLSRTYAPLPDRMQAFSRWARAIPKAVAQIRANLRTPLPRTYVEIGRIRFGGLANYLEDGVPGVFAAVTDPALRAEFESATAEAVQALKELDAWLEGQQPLANDAFALGAELFQEMLRAMERVDVPLGRLEEIGRADLERNLQALEAACGQYAPGRSIRECIGRVQAKKPEGGAVEGARDQLGGLEDFLRSKDLATIPGPERALVEESPPHQRSNSAYIDIPGPYEGGLPSIYYIAPPDPSWTPEEQAAYVPGEADLLFISVHEVWPGHFLQFLHSNRSRSKVGRVFVGYAFAEGWAHYTEEMMWEAGLGNGDPETHIGQLLNALLRNVRYLSTIGLHTKGMTVEESERMFREKAYQDPGNARQQAARGTFDPAYLNYTLGKLMIRRLREDWTRERGGRAAWRQFHDEFLSYGGPPIPLVRRAMLGEDAGPPL